MIFLARALHLFAFVALLLCLPKGATAQPDALKGMDATYSKYVRNNDLRGALNYTCHKFQINCQGISIVSSTNETVMATTQALGNQITLYKNAFTYLLKPHPGWLASIIQHEKVHTRQPFALRTIVQNAERLFLRDNTINASLEYEAWSAMLNYRKVYALDCMMVLDIHQQSYYYGKVMQRNGALPEDEEDEIKNYMPYPAYDQAVLTQCRREKEQIEDTP